jgi:hypothetical protein
VQQRCCDGNRSASSTRLYDSSILSGPVLRGTGLFFGPQIPTELFVTDYFGTPQFKPILIVACDDGHRTPIRGCFYPPVHRKQVTSVAGPVLQNEVETFMPNKSPSRKRNQPAMSPLLRALTFSRAAHVPVTQAMLLQCYAALDAFKRGHGSRDLFMTLGRHFLVSEELCRLGLEPEGLGYIESAHAAMVQIDLTEHQAGGWTVGDDEYLRLCAALSILDAQLSAASLEMIARAEARMVEGLLRAGQKQAVAEAPTTVC